MQLPELLESISAAIDKQQAVSQVKKKANPLWEATKKYIDDLSANYAQIVSKNRLSPRESRAGRLTRKEFQLGRKNGFLIELVEYTTNQGAVEKVWYVALDNKTNAAYVRYL